MSQAFINSLKEELQKPLPGSEVQWEMAHVNREKILPEELENINYRQSAVLLLIYKKGNDYYLPLTERQTYKGAHSGQISLPGGKYEDKDETLQNTALRECAEEIGAHNKIEILGALTPVYIPVSGFVVNPFVAFLHDELPQFNVDVNEVKELIHLSLADLLKPELKQITTVEPMPGLKLKTPYFNVQGKVIWGATAMLLNEFKTVLKSVDLK
jgi:8-oxo-dGTP pyrophosphatase MutT (NUDIX family)